MRTSPKILTIFAAAAVALAPLGLSFAAPAHAAFLTATISPSGVSFTENAATPAFTITTPPLTSTVTNDTYTEISIWINTPPTPPPSTYWAVNSACPTTDSALSACNVSSVQVDGQEVSGVLAKKGNPIEQIKLTFPTPVASGKTVSVSLSVGAFTAGAAGTYDLLFVPFWSSQDYSQTDSAETTLTSVAGGGGGGTTSPSASITLGAAQGQLVAGSSVAIAASGLQAAAPYSVIVESNPQLLTPANATATNGAVNTTVTLPSNLGAGWHTLTFSSTAADGSAVTSVLYFEVSSTGTLLGTSTTKPATLAQTGFDGLPLAATALTLLIVGTGVTLLARRKRTS